MGKETDNNGPSSELKAAIGAAPALLMSLTGQSNGRVRLQVPRNSSQHHLRPLLLLRRHNSGAFLSGHAQIHHWPLEKMHAKLSATFTLDPRP